MATYFVDSAATGTGTGADWTNAYTSLVTALSGKVNGDIILIDYHHSETLSAHLSFTVTTAATQRGGHIRSVDKTTSPANTYHFGAKIITNNFNLKLGCVVEGLDFDNTASATGIIIESAYSFYNQCTFRKQAAQAFRPSAASSFWGEFANCTFELGSSYTVAFSCGVNVIFRIVNPTFSGTKGTNASLLGVTTAGATNITLINADISAFDNILDTSTAGNQKIDVTLRRCVLPATFEYDDAVAAPGVISYAGTVLTLIGCVTGTSLSAPVYNVDAQYHEGWCKTVSTRYRTGGASDGTTPYGFEMLAAANRTWKQSHRCTRTTELGAWVTSGAARTVTVYVAHNAVGAGGSGALQNDVCWAELEGPWVGASPSAKGYVASSMCALDASPANLTTDSTSTWTGSSIATHQQIDFTFTPAISGQAIVRVYLAPESGSDMTIYVDPKLGVA